MARSIEKGLFPVRAVAGGFELGTRKWFAFLA